MNAYLRAILQLTALCLMLNLMGFAADASLYVVHGVPGRDVATNVNPGLPVDILLNDEICVIRGLVFGSNIGPLTLPPGTYDVKVSPANSIFGCTNPPETESTVQLDSGSSWTLVLALSGNNSPSLLKFNDILSTLKVGQGRVTIANATGAGTLEVTLTQTVAKNPIVRKFSLASGAQSTFVLPIGFYSLQATANGASSPLVTGAATSDNQSVNLVYMVGSTTNNSGTVVTRLIRDVF